MKKFARIIIFFTLALFVGSTIALAAPSQFKRIPEMKIPNLVLSKVNNVNATVGNSFVDAEGKLTFPLTGTISTNGPATVHYRWVCSDGEKGYNEELKFPAAGTNTLTATYFTPTQIAGQARHIWVAIEIISPNRVTSNKVNITVPAK